MSSEQMIWLTGAALAATFLLKMMRDRQIALNQMIRSSVEEKMQWSRKRAKAAKMARTSARKKAAEEKVMGEMLASDTSSDHQVADANGPNANGPTVHSRKEAESLM